MYTETHCLLTAAIAGCVYKENFRPRLVAAVAALFPDLAMLAEIAVKFLQQIPLVHWTSFTDQFNQVTHSFLIIGIVTVVLLVLANRSKFYWAWMFGWVGHSLLDAISHKNGDRVGYLWPNDFDLGTILGLFDYRTSPGSLVPADWNFALDFALLAIVAWQSFVMQRKCVRA